MKLRKYSFTGLVPARLPAGCDERERELTELSFVELCLFFPPGRESVLVRQEPGEI